LDDDVIARAETHLSEENRKFEQVIGELEDVRKQLAAEQENARQIREDNERLNHEHKHRRELFEQQVADELTRAKEKAARLVEDARERAEQLVDELSDLKKQKDSEQFYQNINAAKVKTKTAFNELNKNLNTRATNEAYVLPRPLKVHDEVMITGLEKKATVQTLPDSAGYITVRAGIMNMKVKADEVRLIGEKAKKGQGKKPSTSVGVSRAQRDVSTTLDIRGMNTLDADNLIDEFIDHAIMHSLGQVTILHGKGTGVLRSYVREKMKNNKQVKSFRLGRFGEGEDGVTIVEI